MSKPSIKVTITDKTLSKSKKRKMEKILAKEFEKRIEKIIESTTKAICEKLFLG